MKTVLQTATLACLLAALPSVQATDADNGKTLVDKHCTSCHDDSVYSRENRRVKSMEALQKQVKRCELNLGLKWFDDDVSDVVSYLNDSYYRF
jgi:cytochrome c553